jgi:hypothetical protein
VSWLSTASAPRDDATLRAAVAALRGGEAGKGALGRRAQEEIAAPLVHSMERVLSGETTPKIRRSWTSPGGGQSILLELQEQIVPVSIREDDGKRQLSVYRPVSADALPPGEPTHLEHAAYGGKAPMPPIEISRSFASKATARIGGERLDDGEYAAALFDLVDIAITAARSDARRQTWDKNLKPPGGQGILQRLEEAARSPKASPGPPSARADDLVAIGRWGGRIFAVTSQREGDHPLRLWRGDRSPSEGIGWSEVNAPWGSAKPGRGARVVFDDAGLWVAGGFGHEHGPSKTNCLRSVFSQGDGVIEIKTTTEAGMPRGLAEPAVASVKGRLVVTGGMAGYYTHRNRNTFRSTFKDWDTLDVAPSGMVGARTAVHEGLIVYGPDEECSGAVHAYDVDGREWRVLPSLSGLGECQMAFVDPRAWGLDARFSGPTLVASGGRMSDGTSSHRLFALDVAAKPPGWLVIGTSQLVGGKAQWIMDETGLVSLLMRPGASLCLSVNTSGAASTGEER